jgi:hypothetical protein
MTCDGGATCDSPAAPLCNPSTNECSAWPIGSEAALVVPLGQTTHISAGEMHDYASIDVEGTLQIDPGSSNGTAWTILGSAGNVTINGTISGQCGQNTGGTFGGNEPAADGTLTGPALSYTIVQQPGGAGGTVGIGQCLLTSLPSGSSVAGNGGGGSGDLFADFNHGSSVGYCCQDWGPSNGGGDATATAGGNGGAAVSCPCYGAGATTYGSYGQSGGGGGGFRGAHGCLLYMKVAKGAVLSGGGVIDLSGQDGGHGGSDSAGYNDNSPCNCLPCQRYESGGGPGGGAAGGSGGSFELRYDGDAGIQLLQSVTTGNGVRLAGGAGGQAGTSNQCWLATAAQSGTHGSVGNLHITMF